MSARTHPSATERAEEFAKWVGIRVPILLSPMAGACPTSLSIAVANAGGLAACGALLMNREEILGWSEEFRAGSRSHFQLNLWIPEPAPRRDAQLEMRQRAFLESWGPPIGAQASEAKLQDFGSQCAAALEVAPRVISSIMGLYPASFVAKIKAAGILWFATVTTVAEAKAAEEAGADAVVAQGTEAGGHRGAFNPDLAERQMVGLLALIPQVTDAVRIPVIAAGGISDGRGVAAALVLGASAVQIGTGLLRTPQAKTPRAYAERLRYTEAHETVVTRAFSGRPGRSIANDFVRAAFDGPPAAPYPVQRGLTSALRESAREAEDVERMQAWAGQAAKLARAEAAETVIAQVWADALALVGYSA